MLKMIKVKDYFEDTSCNDFYVSSILYQYYSE